MKSPIGRTSSLEEAQIASIVHKSTHTHQIVHNQIPWLHCKLISLQQIINFVGYSE